MIIYNPFIFSPIICIKNIFNSNLGRYFWQVLAVNSDNVTSQSEIREFTVCVNTPPLTPNLLFPSNSSIDQSTSIILTWLPINFIKGDFGVVCDPNRVNRQLTVFLDTNNPPITVVSRLVDTATQFSMPLKLNTLYYWYIQADNGIFTSNSSVQSFKTKQFSCQNTGCIHFNIIYIFNIFLQPAFMDYVTIVISFQFALACNIKKKDFKLKKRLVLDGKEFLVSMLYVIKVVYMEPV